MLLATLTGLCQMPRTSKWTTLAVVFVIGVLAVALYYPGTAWSHLLMQLSFLPAVGAVAYFIHGGGAHLCQMLFDRERAVMADGDRNPAVIPVHVESPS
jgi:hypothetical protein